jgi:hypothetical protein
MTVTYDATHHGPLQVSPMTRLICHLCRELTHPRLHKENQLVRGYFTARSVGREAAETPSVPTFWPTSTS